MHRIDRRRHHGGLALFLMRTLYMLGARGDADDLVSELREGSWPTTLAELNDWYEKPPPEENAALLYIEAAELSNLAGNPPDIACSAGDALAEKV
jgi:hypothetical protein